MITVITESTVSVRAVWWPSLTLRGRR